MPKVSFILPAYKREFLEKAIKSILEQSYSDFELVVVDDCSPENLKEVVDKFSDKRLSYHRNETNLGGKDLIAAWEHALEFAKCEWCVLASDDDIYHRDYLKEMVGLVEKYPNVDVVHARIACINKMGDVTYLSYDRREWESGVRFFFNAFKNHMQAAPEFMFRLSALKKIGGFVRFPAAWGSDDATWAELAAEKGIACSERILFYFRQSGINISTSKKYNQLKLKAHLMLGEWMESFVYRLQAQDEEERFILEHGIRELREINVDTPVIEKATTSGLKTLVSFIFDKHAPRYLRHYVIRRALHWPLNLANYLKLLKRHA